MTVARTCGSRSNSDFRSYVDTIRGVDADATAKTDRSFLEPFHAGPEEIIAVQHHSPVRDEIQRRS